MQGLLGLDHGLRAQTPGYSEYATQAIQDSPLGLLADVLPVIGDAKGLAEFGAAPGWGTALGLLPFVPGILSKRAGEISDDAYKLREKEDFEGHLGDAVTHEELFAAYPELRNAPLSLRNAPSDSYFEHAPTLRFNVHDRNNRAVELLHELQHGVDYLDNTDFGTSPHNVEVLKNTNPKFLEYYLDQMEKDPLAVTLMDKAMALEDKGEDATTAYKSFYQYMNERLYLSNLGETRARNTVDKYLDSNFVGTEVNTWKKSDFE